MRPKPFYPFVVHLCFFSAMQDYFSSQGAYRQKPLPVVCKNQPRRRQGCSGKRISLNPQRMTYRRHTEDCPDLRARMGLMNQYTAPSLHPCKRDILEYDPALNRLGG